MSTVLHQVAASGGRAEGYDGFDSCPLTVKRAMSAPSFPRWLIVGLRPARLSWMLKGCEWLAGPGGPIAQ